MLNIIWLQECKLRSIKPKNFDFISPRFIRIFEALYSVVKELGVQAAQVHPQKFWFDETPGKIPENLGTDVLTSLFYLCE